MNTIKIDSKGAKLIAHRGLSGIEKENTCSAFVAAGNRSYYGIETDVHKTNDGKFVVIHDDTTKRVSLEKYDINVEKSCYDEIKDIVLPDIDNTFGRTDIRIPLLKDYVFICKKYGKKCVLELKNPFRKEDIVKLTEEIGAIGYLSDTIFISFDFENCVNLRSILPNAEIQYLTMDEVTPGLVEKLKDNSLYLDIYYKRLNKHIVSSLHSQGIKVNCWTCDTKEEGEALADMGVDYITSNILE